MNQAAIDAFQAQDFADREAKARALRLRFKADADRLRRSQTVRRVLRMIWRRFMLAYWLACCTIIAVGVNDRYPGIGQRVAYALRDPAMELEKPFANCEIAHDQGFYSLPRKSPAYAAWQDRRNDGRACEPYWGHYPNIGAVGRRIVNRLEGD
jgi:hypothetical protein